MSIVFITRLRLLRSHVSELVLSPSPPFSLLPPPFSLSGSGTTISHPKGPLGPLGPLIINDLNERQPEKAIVGPHATDEDILPSR